MKRTTSLFLLALLLFVSSLQAATTLTLFRGDGTVINVSDTAIAGSSLIINVDITQKKIEMGVYDNNNDEYAAKVYFVSSTSGSALIAGTRYTNVVQYLGTPKSSPSFRVSTNNSIFWPTDNPGWFEIREVNYTSPGSYNKLAIDFGTGDGTVGSWRYNSLIAPIPEPSAISIALIGIGLTFRRRR